MKAIRKFTFHEILRLIIVFQMMFCGFLPGNYVPDTIPVKNPYKIVVLGTGYVGLVCGAGLAEIGHIVVCADIDHKKIELLQNGDIPIYEPGLKELVQNNIDAKRLFFTDKIDQTIQESELVFIAVGTPTSFDGSADLSYVESAAEMIARNLNTHKTICIKSTVPIGTGKKIFDLIAKEDFEQGFELVFNPEFLREGTAVYDFFEADRVVIGVMSEVGKKIMGEVYRPLLEKGIPFFYTSIESAEAIKYASNAFLAVKISFINEFANLCDATGADVLDVAFGMGLDKRIGHKFLNPGPGYGGSCFPKDTLALIQMAKNANVKLNVVDAAIDANEKQKQVVVEKTRKLLDGNLNGKTIGIMGLAFKPNTDDVRYSPAIEVIESILREGGKVKAYDPKAMENMRQFLPQIEYVTNLYQVAVETDAIILLTEWDEFRSMDLSKISSLMKTPIMIDTRNILDPDKMKNLGFKFANIGRPNVL